MFPAWFFDVLILGALTLTALSAACLLALLYRDWRNGRLW